MLGLRKVINKLEYYDRLKDFGNDWETCCIRRSEMVPYKIIKALYKNKIIYMTLREIKVNTKEIYE